MLMHRAFAFVALVLLLVSVVTVDLSNGQEATKDSGVPLAVSLDVDRTSAHLNDSIVLTVLVKNTSKEPIFLYGNLAWGMSSSLFLFVTDENGKPVPITYLDDALPPTPSRADKNLFIKLNPQHIFGTNRTDTLSDLVPKPGVYYLQVEYHGPLPRRFAAGTPAWGVESPRIESNKVRIEVR